MQVEEGNEERLELTESYPDNKQSKQHDDQQMLMNCLRELKRGQQAVINILEFLLKREGSLIDDWTSISVGSRSPDDIARADKHLALIHDNRVPEKQLQSEQSSKSLELLNGLTIDSEAPDNSTASRTRKPSGTGRPKRKPKQSLLRQPTLNLRDEDVKQGEPTSGTLTSSSNTRGNSKAGSTSDRMDWQTESSRESTQLGRIHRTLRGSQRVGQHDKLGEAREGFRITCDYVELD